MYSPLEPTTLWSLTERTSHRHYWWACFSTQHNTGIFKPLTKNIKWYKRTKQHFMKAKCLWIYWIVEQVPGSSANAMRHSIPKAATCSCSTIASHGGEVTASVLQIQQHPTYGCSLCVLIPWQTQGLPGFAMYPRWRIKNRWNIKQTHLKLAAHILCILERKWKWKGWWSNHVYLYLYHSRLSMTWQESWNFETKNHFWKPTQTTAGLRLHTLNPYPLKVN